MSPRSPRKLRIGIDATLVPGIGAGGVESVLRALVSALAALDDGTTEYVLVTSKQAPDWLDSIRGENQHVAVMPGTHLLEGLMETGRLLGRQLIERIGRFRLGDPWPQVPISRGFIESLGCDVMHFPTQSFTVCATPSIYHPHDLQHRHYPEFFSAHHLAWREVMYRAGCSFSAAVAVASQWIADDVVRELGVRASKIQVIPWAPPTQSVAKPGPDERASLLAKYGLAQPFALYPAMLWQSKNHLRLLEAVALLRDRDRILLNLVCTGSQRLAWWSEIEAALDRLQLRSLVKFIGVVDARELRGLYAASSFIVIPTLFEAASAPMFEAWLEGMPVTCSAVTSLPEQAGGAALLFDPLSVEEIAHALKRMVSEPELREKLAADGTRRLQDFDWQRTARAFRALYRRVARVPLTPEDEKLLAWDWMRHADPSSTQSIHARRAV